MTKKKGKDLREEMRAVARGDLTPAEAAKLDWSKFPSSMPREGIVRPTGKAKADLIARMDRAFVRLKWDQTSKACAATTNWQQCTRCVYSSQCHHKI